MNSSTLSRKTSKALTDGYKPKLRSNISLNLMNMCSRLNSQRRARYCYKPFLILPRLLHLFTMIQKALKFILKDRFGRNSSPKAFLVDQSLYKLFTWSPSIFSDLKTSLREALGSETSPVIDLTYLLPVGQIWGRWEVAQCFYDFFNHRATCPYFHRGCQK